MNPQIRGQGKEGPDAFRVSTSVRARRPWRLPPSDIGENSAVRSSNRSGRLSWIGRALPGNAQSAADAPALLPLIDGKPLRPGRNLEVEGRPVHA